jgi:hypothetical protein
MIIVELRGGLGNQMFQYALGRRLALLRNTELKLDTRFLERQRKNPKAADRPYGLAIFNIQALPASEKEIQSIIGTGIWRKIGRRIIPMIKRSYLVESALKYDSRILQNQARQKYLEGYWQTEKYFSDISETIRRDFTFKRPLTGKNAELAERLQQSTSVVIHVRRGDYFATDEGGRNVAVCTAAYYQNAIKLLKSKIAQPHYFIFSDEPDWVKRNFQLTGQVTIVDHNNTAADSHCDLQLMSMGKHMIIANSTFSWWAAWLNRNPDKIICVPEIWSYDPGTYNRDIIPKSWLKVPIEERV